MGGTFESSESRNKSSHLGVIALTANSEFWYRTYKQMGFVNVLKGMTYMYVCMYTSLLFCILLFCSVDVNSQRLFLFLLYVT